LKELKNGLPDLIIAGCPATLTVPPHRSNLHEADISDVRIAWFIARAQSSPIIPSTL
jgi:hypothetical protein